MTVNIYAIGDLHLSHAVDKPMDVFGEHWLNHSERIKASWSSRITQNDVILIPGDISWAMTLSDALFDLRWIQTLPGTQIFVRGNHDYWWHGIGKVRNALGERQYALQNDSVTVPGYTICGTRGWLLPNHPKFTEEDHHIYLRESERLRMSLEHARQFNQLVIAMLHYPPCSQLGEDTRFTELLEQYQVTTCIYGHLHGAAHRYRFDGEKNGVQYQLVSADYIDFTPVPVRL